MFLYLLLPHSYTASHRSTWHMSYLCLIVSRKKNSINLKRTDQNCQFAPAFSPGRRRNPKLLLFSFSTVVLYQGYLMYKFLVSGFPKQVAPPLLFRFRSHPALRDVIHAPFRRSYHWEHLALLVHFASSFFVLSAFPNSSGPSSGFPHHV